MELRDSSHFLKEPTENLVYRSHGWIFRQVKRNLLDDALRRPRVLHVRIAVCPIPAWVERIPRRAQVGPRAGIVAMLPEAVANPHFGIPYGFEQMDQVILGGSLPTGLHDECAVFEILQAQRGFRLRDIFPVIRKSPCEPITLLHRCLAGGIGWISLPDIDWVFPPRNARIGWKIPAIVQRIDTGTIEPLNVREWLAGLGNHRDADDAAHDVRVRGIEHETRMLDRIEVIHDLPQPRIGLADCLAHTFRARSGELRRLLSR